MIDLRIDRVSKRYLVPHVETEKRGLLSKIAGLRTQHSEFWAVKDVSFEVPRGQALGLIGHNGAGKSTILKLLSNITRPSSGAIYINGRLSSLIEVGSGFHPELTGRENIFLCGSILGMKRAEIRRKFDDIVQFAGIPDFIDTPVKRYSSGMYVRLGFAIAAHLDPEILLLDEVLAVGDAGFQAKCIERVLELKKSGVTIIFISHDLSAVEKLCDRVILMRKGQVIADADPHSAIEEYQNTGFTAGGANVASAQFNTRQVQIRSVAFQDANGVPATTFRTGDAFRAVVDYIATEDLPSAVFEMSIYQNSHEQICLLSTKFRGKTLDIAAGEGRIEFVVPELSLHAGLYTVSANIEQIGALTGVDWQIDCATFQVLQGISADGNFYMPHDWQLVTSDVPVASRR